MKTLRTMLLGLLLCLLLAMPAFAATTYYETIKDNVPIRSSYSADASVVRQVAKTGTVIAVTSSTTNSAGNLWYKTSDGNWVFSGNVKAHSHSYSGGICTSTGCGYEYPLTATNMTSTTFVVSNTDGAPIGNRPYSNNSTRVRTTALNATVTVVGKVTNQANNLWYKLSDGNWIFSGNVEEHKSHSYSGGICSVCKHEFPLTVTPISETSYMVSNKDGAPVWNRPYSNNSTTVKTLAYQTIVSVVAKTTNQANNLWYKLSDGNWIFSGNIEVHTHNYSGGICGDCKHEFLLTVTPMNNVSFTVSNADGAPIWNRPYSNNSTTMKTLAYQTMVSVIGKTTNQAGNLWYKLSDGNWIFSGNVSDHSHDYSGGICNDCKRL